MDLVVHVASDSLMLVLKCIDHEEFGNLYALNEEITDEVKEEKNKNELLSDGKSYILIEESTGKVIYEKNSHERYAPASMTKIVSMILIMEDVVCCCKNGKRRKRSFPGRFSQQKRRDRLGA